MRYKRLSTFTWEQSDVVVCARHARFDANADSTYLAVVNPGARNGLIAAERADSMEGAHAHHRVLKCMYKRTRPDARAPKVDDRVDDSLARAVKGDFTATVASEHAGAGGVGKSVRRATFEVGEVGSSSESVGGWVFTRDCGARER
jgi:hypothetical protein